MLARSGAGSRIARTATGDPRAADIWLPLLSASLAVSAKLLAWLGVFLPAADRCPEALAVALEPPLLKCFPPAQQTVMLAHLAAVALACIMRLS